MKKQDVLKSLSPAFRAIVDKLDRRKPYVISWHDKTMIIQITHFYKDGIQFKPLSSAEGFRHSERQGLLRYYRLDEHKIRPATLDDIATHMGEGTRFFTEYFADTRIFLKNHKGETEAL